MCASVHGKCSLVGGFGSSDALEGSIANFRMWNYEMSSSELNALSCIDYGNVISQQDMDFTNTEASQITTITFTCGKLVEHQMQHTAMLES